MVVFAGCSGFLHYVKLASHKLVTIWRKCDKKQNSKKKINALLEAPKRRPVNLGEIITVKANFGKYLKEICLSEHYKQLSLNYFVK